MKQTYKIKITPLSEHKYCSVKPYKIKVETERLNWYMDQYQRNRDPFKWEIIT